MTPMERVLEKLPDAKRTGQGWTARCPAHKDRRPSLSITEGDDGRVLLHCHAGCAVEDVVAEMGLELRDLMPDGNTGVNHVPSSECHLSISSKSVGTVYPTAHEAVAELERRLGKLSAQWTYCDTNGKPVGVVVRWDGPDGKDIRPVSRSGSGWVIGGMPEPRPLYRLSDLAAADCVWVVEGEKVADVDRALGIVATTSPHGANSAHKTDWRPLAGKRVVITPDRDDAGERYANDVLAELSKLSPAPLVKLVRLADRWTELPEGGDLADVLALAGGDAESIRADLERMADETLPIELGATVSVTVTPDAAVAPRYRPFPVEVVPSPIGEYSLSVAKGMDVDPILVIGPTLAVFAGAVGNAVRVKVREGWIEPCSIWTGLIALPGSLKTQTQDAAAEPVHDAQRRADVEYEHKMREYEVALDERDAAKKQAKNRSNPQIPSKPVEPVRRQWLVGDTTPEALAHILKDNTRGVVALHDELAALFGGFGRYAKNAGGSEPGAAFYKSAFNATPHTENRKGEPRKSGYIRVEAPLISIAGAIQPGAFQRLVIRQYVEDGLASRFLWFWPPDQPGGWVDEQPGDPRPKVNYFAAYARLCEIPLNVAPDGKLSPGCVGLSKQAKSVARAWVNRLRDRIADAPDSAVRAALAKLKGIVFRLALLYHLTDWAGRGGNEGFGEISEDTLSRAIVTADWFADEAVRVYALLCETKEEAKVRGLVEWIDGRGGTATTRDLTHGLRAYRNKTEDAEKALYRLVQSNLAVWEPVQNPSGGRPTRQVRLIQAVTVTETPAKAHESGGFGDGDGTDSANGDDWGEV